MRDGRRKRLGLVEGSEGTVGDTYLDRILTDEEAANTRNVVKADPNVNFDAGNYNYVTDLYDYFSSGGAEEDTTPVVTPPSDGGGGGGDGGGGTSVGNPGTGGTTPGTGGEDNSMYGGDLDQGGQGDGITNYDYTPEETTEQQEDIADAINDLGDNYDIYDPDDITGGTNGNDIEVENISSNPYDIPMDIDDPGASIENIIAQKPPGTISGAPVVNPSLEEKGPITVESNGDMYQGVDAAGNPQYIGNKYDEFGTDGDVYADAGSMVTAEDVQDEQKFMDKFKGLLPENFDFKKAVINGLISAVTGKPIMMALDILTGAMPENSSQTEYDSYSPEQKAAIDAAYGSGGVMDGYNVVSGFGEGVEATVNKRIDDYEKNYTSAEIEGFLTNPNHTYSKLKKLQTNVGFKTTENIDVNETTPGGNTIDDITGDVTDIDGNIIGNIMDEFKTEDEIDEPDEIEDFLNEPEDIYKDPILDMVDTDLEKAEKAKAKADKAKEAEIEANQQKAKEEADRIQNEKKAAKALADKAKAEADMQQKIKDAEEAQKQKEQNDYNDKIEKAIEDAKKDPTSGMGSCFIAGTKVTMADGTLKNIEDVEVGDKVKGHKEENTVIKLDPTLLADRKLYSFNNNEHYFFTSEHPFMTEEGWKSIKPEKTKERDGIELYKQLKGELKVGDKLVTDNDSIEITDIKSKEMNNPEMPLYNFNVSNDSSYIADDYVVHNKGCFIKGTLITMADGTTKPVEQVDLGDEVAVGGKVFAVGRFLNTELYEYKGIKVSGSHMVNEDGTWMRVRDTKHGKSLGDDQNTVYVFGSENRRILINDILFTDYFEVNEQDMLMNDEKDFFNNSKKYGKVIDEHNVEILNAN